MHAGREKRSKPVKKKARAVADEEPELVGPSKRDRFLKKSGRNKSDLDESWPSPQPSRPDEEGETSSAVPRSQRRGSITSRKQEMTACRSTGKRAGALQLTPRVYLRRVRPVGRM